MAQCLLIALFKPNVDAIFFSTSPPLIGVAAAVAHIVRRIPTSYWAMDLNPDQLIALGKLKPTDFTARLLEAINRFILRNCALVIALDRFMAERLLARQRGLRDKLLVMPPWPQEEHVEQIERDANPFRQKHGLDGKFVIMYSGNHSPSNPLATLLDASLQFKDDPDVRFLFVGGGLLKKDVERLIEQHQLTHVISLPYQPLAELKYSLSAADVHVVSLGDAMIGIIHPCKIYGAMAVGRPILYLGPRPSHVSDILDANRIGWHVSHGDVAGVVGAIRQMRAMDAAQLAAMGETARAVLRQTLGQELLCRQFCDALEQTLEPIR
jgi:glycosyltransferase involved in cell wall biosynthesis